MCIRDSYGCGPTPFGIELGKQVKDKNGKKKVVEKLPWRATTQTGKIYIHVLEWPEASITLPQVDSTIERAYFLGSDLAALKVTQSDESTEIRLPETKPDSLVPVICLELQTEPTE